MFQWLKNIFVGTEKTYINQRLPQLTGKKFNIEDSLNISTVYTCIDIKRSTMARLPLELYQTTDETGKVKDKTNPLYTTLHYNFNNYTTSHTAISYLETVRNLKGNSFLKINQNKTLSIIYTWQVVGYGIMNDELYYFVKETENGEAVPINASEILHFRTLTRDGIWGLNPIESLRANLSATDKGLTAIDSFYENNANSPKAVKSTVSGANQAVMIAAVEKFKKEYGGAENSGKMIVLPPNTEIQELKLNFADAEFINTIRFNTEQIAALFNVPAYLAGINTASKFNSVEFMSLGFKVNTIAAICQMYRQEFEFKLLTEKERLAGKSIEFNTNAMIELDHKAKTEGYQKLFQVGAISPNQIATYEGIPKDKSGDFKVVPMNMISTEKFNIKDNEKE